MKQLRFGQLRGISPFVYVLLQVFGLSVSECRAEPLDIARFPKVIIQEKRDFFSAAYSNLMAGNFTDNTHGGGCGQALALLESGRVEVVDALSGERKISDLSTEFPFQEAVVVDLNNDSRDDLLAYDRRKNIWLLAFSLGNGDFKIQSKSLVDWVPSKLPFLVQKKSETEVIVNSRYLRQRLSYQEESGLKVYSVDQSSEDTTIVGLLMGAKDAEQHLSSEVFHFRNIAASYYRHSPEGLRAVLHLPQPIDPDEILTWDVNRDGYEDILLSGWSLGLWWIGFGQEQGFIEYPLSGFESLGTSSRDIAVADIDCDGFKEALQRRNQSRNLRLSKGVESTKVPAGTFGRAISDSQGPFVCVGYRPFSRNLSWGYDDMCPKGYAVIGSSYDENVRGSACCRLPESDMLSETSVMTRGSCPEDFVVTGYTANQEFRCTKINLDRYRLSKKLPGVHWGVGSMRAKEKSDILVSAIPIAFRFAVGRLGFQGWEEEGCIGPEWGSILTGWTSKECYRHTYQLIEYSGRAGDPVPGTPVKIFPDCRGKVNRFDPDAGCEPQSGVGSGLFSNGSSVSR